MNAGDKGAVLRSLLTDTNLVGITRHTAIADVDVVTARGKVQTGIKAHCDVAFAGCVVEERLKTATILTSLFIAHLW